MGLTSQPTKTDGSIGQPKSNKEPVTDLSTQVPAVEWERIKTFLIDVCDEVGNHVGTAGDLNTRVDSLETGAILADGTVPMADDLDLGGNNITNVALVDGVDIEDLDAEVGAKAEDLQDVYDADPTLVLTDGTPIAITHDSPTGATITITDSVFGASLQLRPDRVVLGTLGALYLVSDGDERISALNDRVDIWAEGSRALRIRHVLDANDDRGLDVLAQPGISAGESAHLIHGTLDRNAGTTDGDQYLATLDILTGEGPQTQFQVDAAGNLTLSGTVDGVDMADVILRDGTVAMAADLDMAGNALDLASDGNERIVANGDSVEVYAGGSLALTARELLDASGDVGLLASATVDHSGGTGTEYYDGARVDVDASGTIGDGSDDPDGIGNTLQRWRVDSGSGLATVAAIEAGGTIHCTSAVLTNDAGNALVINDSGGTDRWRIDPEAMARAKISGASNNDVQFELIQNNKSWQFLSNGSGFFRVFDTGNTAARLTSHYGQLGEGDVGLDVTPDVNIAAGTDGAYTGFRVNVTETGLGDGVGPHLIADLQAGGVSMGKLSNIGDLTLNGDLFFDAGGGSGRLTSGLLDFDQTPFTIQGNNLNNRLVVDNSVFEVRVGGELDFEVSGDPGTPTDGDTNIAIREHQTDGSSIVAALSDVVLGNADGTVPADHRVLCVADRTPAA